MGNAKINRLIKQYCRWSDKTAPRHKHNYTVHAVAQLRRDDGFTVRFEYYDVMKCEHCNSFITIPKEFSVYGFIGDTLINNDLPIIKLRTGSKYRMGLLGATLDTN